MRSIFTWQRAFECPEGEMTTWLMRSSISTRYQSQDGAKATVWAAVWVEQEQLRSGKLDAFAAQARPWAKVLHLPVTRGSTSAGFVQPVCG